MKCVNKTIRSGHLENVSNIFSQLSIQQAICTFIACFVCVKSVCWDKVTTLKTKSCHDVNFLANGGTVDKVTIGFIGVVTMPTLWLEFHHINSHDDIIKHFPRY